MREIRFAWVCRNIHFNQIERVELTDNDLICGSRPSWITSDNCEVIAKILPTGLPDQNGMEIWEGDIVKWSDGILGEVYWDQADVAFSLRWEGESWFLNDDGMLCGMEVIGNIYENPELVDKESM